MSDRLSHLFFRDRRLLVLTILMIVVSGLSAYSVLPKAEDPVLSDRIGRIITRFPGANAERVESLVTEKLEERIREVEEIKHVDSDSRSGVSVITIELNDQVAKTAEVWSRVRDKIRDAEPALPAEALQPQFDELEITAFTLITSIRWDRDDEPNYGILRRLAETLEDRLEAVPGTAEVELWGDPDEEVLVEVDSARMAAMDLTIAEVADAVRLADAKVAAGSLRHSRSDLLFEVAGELEAIEHVLRIPIRQVDGATVRLGDFATVSRGVREPVSDLAVIDGQPAVVLAARMEDGRRIDDWGVVTQDVLAAFESELPRGLTLSVLFDQGIYVHQRLSGLLTSLLLGMGCVVGVIFFMMGARSAILVGSALPLSTLMVLAAMNVLDVPLNQMSVSGLIIALGLLIDNAIVAVDETKQRLREGLAPADAVSRSVKHLAGPLFGSTLTTGLAFMPIVLMPGNAGEFVGSIGVSVILAIASSLFLALTIVPALTGLLARVSRPGTPMRIWADGFTSRRLTEAYRRSLDFVLRRPAVGLCIAIVLPLFGFLKSSELPEQFFPQADRDQFQLELRLPTQASLERTLATTSRARDIMLDVPGVTKVQWFIGTSAPKFYYNMIGGQDESSFYAHALVQMESAEIDTATVNAVQARLDRELPHVQAIARKLEQGPPFMAPIEIRLFGPDLEELRLHGDEVRRILAGVPNVTQTQATLTDGQPKLWFDLDDEASRRSQLENVSIARQLSNRLEGIIGGSILEGSEEMPVRLRESSAGRRRLDHIQSLSLVAARLADPDRGLDHIPLTALGRLQVKPELSSLPRRDGNRVNTIRGYVRAGVLPSTVLERLNEELSAQGFAMPAGYRMEFGGETAQRDQAITNLMASVAVLVAIMVATLVLSFHSFRLAAIIGGVAALAIGLGLQALWLFGYPFGFMAIVGTMGLVGIAVNDSIVVLAALKANPKAFAGSRKAIRETVVRSTRHVLATTLTTIAGFMPLILDGGQFWPPLAVAIAGGVAGCTLLALYFVPSAFVIVQARRFRIKANDVENVNERNTDELAPRVATC